MAYAAIAPSMCALSAGSWVKSSEGTTSGRAFVRITWSGVAHPGALTAATSGRAVKSSSAGEARHETIHDVPDARASAPRAIGATAAWTSRVGAEIVRRVDGGGA